ncbi:hypothetical protein PFMG_00071 [Plasmodium falciparum IGH-CR14]|uniref:Transcription initiation factor IIA subunit 1, putative n=5 Tax=Plasmodium falciparum TaxID=5833 RepID=A0A143ZY73_PLAF7|nr:transcription initiation factor IIA subunit 1, putative [Plasmodium falciparum 3D7]ETW19382.1 hypothetical protein PFFVO_01741 [Plasmodium falciparum Vietnam Oak-Knoll (FVO)]EUR73710.1 hypothetical protein PFBG_01772 [Plasmodium falciparum 7G8]KAF4326777.1 transcription initiation factor IIA subunit 1 [Plasmodium falciparum NF54]KNG73997.1 hypothetical protein PFMG_00071 [Plasmodium falciparum IGH-CR14]SOS77722.1 transcription initiation factor IIA subunit 1, putative [Plasmodium sp. gorill|eukprot:XP_024329043.1 transcription initiation factor IIA subunit 1,putative [Plasmodium falciparum 3D7]
MSLLSDSDLKEIHKKIIDSTIKNCGQFYNARILEAIKMRWIKIYEQKLRNKELGLVSNKKENKNSKIQLSDDFDDDEFEDADVEEKEIVEIQEEVENDPAEEDELNDLDNISISDLSDVDPETNNIIIGVCDKISKPCGRRNVGSNWKIKLKGGLMKIDGKEMFFHGLQGELEF